MTFDFTPTDSGLRIHDQIENTSFSLFANSPITPTRTDTSQFGVPLDAAVEFEASRLTFEILQDVHIWDHGGGFLDNVSFDNKRSLQSGSYELDIQNPAFKCYLLVRNATVTIDTTGENTVCSFDPKRRVMIGVRSFHEQSAGVVTTPRNPEPLATAISTFGSALKTTTPERSYPTLRGQPPDLKVGPQLSIPDVVTPPDTRITIESPPDYASLFAFAPLAYYLAADIEVGAQPRLHLPNETYGFEDARLGVEVLTVLRRCFLLDCIVRTEGLYDIQLRERRILEAHHDFDASHLYELPIAERTEAYLSIPLESLKGYLPWPQMTDVAATLDSIPLLPYLAFSLSGIRSPPDQQPLTTEPNSEEQSPTQQPGKARSFIHASSNATRLVKPADAGALHSAWLANGLPIAGSKPTLSAAISGRHPPSESGPLDVQLVCNESSMAAEVEDAYGTSLLENLSITHHMELSVDEFEAVLRTNPDFLHYIGHIDTKGIRCSDGYLDARTITDIEIRAFFLNGCTSAKQGFALLNNGSIFGVVTTDQIENSTAIEKGRAFARLLDRGFTPADALTVLQQVHDTVEYSVLGDANRRLTPTEDGATYFTINSASVRDDAVPVTLTALPNTDRFFGSVVTSQAAKSTGLLQGAHDLIVTRSTLERAVEMSSGPVIIDGELKWFDEFEPGELWQYLNSSN